MDGSISYFTEDFLRSSSFHGQRRRVFERRWNQVETERCSQRLSESKTVRHCPLAPDQNSSLILTLLTCVNIYLYIYIHTYIIEYIYMYISMCIYKYHRIQLIKLASVEIRVIFTAGILTFFGIRLHRAHQVRAVRSNAV